MNKQYNIQTFCSKTTRWRCALIGIILVVIAFILANNTNLFLAMGAPLFVMPILIVGVVMIGSVALSIAITGIV